MKEQTELIAIPADWDEAVTAAAIICSDTVTVRPMYRRGDGSIQTEFKFKRMSDLFHFGMQVEQCRAELLAAAKSMGQMRHGDPELIADQVGKLSHPEHHNVVHKTDVIKLFMSLPPRVTVEGVEFDLEFIKNAEDDGRIVYKIGYVEEDSPHYQNVKNYHAWNHPFEEGYVCGFLFLIENIADQKDFYVAVEAARLYLINKQIIGT
jgi:hypothetical protein